MNDVQKRGRRTLILLALMFATPIGAAMYMYYSGTSLGPIDSTVKGQLISPPRLLPDTELDSEELHRLRKQWSLIVPADQNCDALCVEALIHIRQIRLSLGPKMPRMQTVFLPAQASAISPGLQDNHPVLIITSPDKSVAIREIIGSYQNGEIFMVDPLGNLMMSYPPGTDMGDIRKDIAHLLKLSGIG